MTKNAYLRKEIDKNKGMFYRAIIDNLISAGKDSFDIAAKKDNGYEYIPYRGLDTVIEQLLHIRSKSNNKLSFIDVGCGIGLISMLAQYMGFEAYGLELRGEYLQYAEQAFGNTGVTLIQGDAFRHNYSQYDVIYYYCPIADKKRQIRLEKRIEKQMRLGSYLIPKLKKGWTEKRKNKEGYMRTMRVVPKGFITEYGDTTEYADFDYSIFTKTI